MNSISLLAPRDMYGKTLVELGEKRSNIFVLNADVAKATKVEEFGDKFKNNYLNVGICEQNMASIAAGLARAGFTAIMSTFASFAPGRCYDQIRQSIAYSNLNVKVASTHPGLSVGADGAMHQGLEDIALMRELPNFIVLAPSDSVQTRKAVIKAIEYKGPVYIRIGRMECPILFNEDLEFEIGKAYTIKKGYDITLMAYGSMVHIINEAALELEKRGVNARVIDMPTIKPIDKGAIIQAAKETKGIITAEDHSVYGGLYSAVCEVTSSFSPCTVKGIAVEDTFGESGKPLDLYKKYGLTKEHILETAMAIL